MKEKKSCLHCMNASVTEEQGATFCLCDFDTDCIYISDPEKRQKNAKAMSEWRKNDKTQKRRDKNARIIHILLCIVLGYFLSTWLDKRKR